MAERRMFTKKIVDSDAFLDMPLSTQALYFHLAMRADDDGFINNPKKIMRMVGAGDDEMKVLIGKRFIIIFESGVIVVKHWKLHNYIPSDRYHETQYLTEKEQIIEKDNKVYTEKNKDLYTRCIQDVDPVKIRLDKTRLDKVRIEQSDKPDYDTLFNSFWELYKKKVGKQKSRDKYIRLLKSTKSTIEQHKAIISGLEKYNDWIDRTETEITYIKNPLTWLNGCHWEDELVLPLTASEQAQKRIDELKAGDK